MPKPRKVKNKLPSVKSRAARRATSPSIDVDKSIKNAKTPTEREPIPAVLAARKDAGIAKKRKQKTISRQKRLRQEKGMERADIIIDKLENKVNKSKTKAKLIKERASDWEDLNAPGEKRKPVRKAAVISTKEISDVTMEDAIGIATSDVRAATMGADDALEDIT